MKLFFYRAGAILRHYCTLWHLKRALVFLFVDIVLLSLVRRGKSGNVLVLKFDHFGDYIIARNFLIRIKQHPLYQNRRVILCANSAIADFIQTYDAAAFDEILWIDRRQLLDDAWARYRILRQVKKIGADVAIQCTYGLESFAGDCVMRASGARQRIGRWVGHIAAASEGSNAGAQSIGTTFYTPLVESDRVIFDFHRHQSLFAAVLPGSPLPTDTRFRAIPVAVPEIAGPYAILMPGASDAFREWPPNFFAEVARYLFSVRRLRSLVLGTAADNPKALAIQHAAPGIDIQNLCGQLTLSQVTYLISGSATGLTNDSGGIHLFAALDRPAVAVSNGVSYGYFHPYPPELAPSVSFVYPRAFYDLPLTPQQRKVQFNSGQHLDITAVLPRNVIARLESLLNEPKGKFRTEE